MPSALRDVVVPDFGLPLEAPRIPATTYEKRCREAYARAECDWLIVYADRPSGSRVDDCWRLYDGGGQQKSSRGGGLTGRLIQFREFCVNSVD